LIMYKFKWTPQMNLRQPEVHKILALLGPRVIAMLLYQLTFIARDNLASRLELGSVSALTYGWMILQVPETLIGTAIGTALLPTISEQFAKGQTELFKQTVGKIQRVLIALAIPSAILLSAVLAPFLDFAFGFDAENTMLLMGVTRAFLAGLLSHCMLELGSRIYFARQNATIPLAGSALNLAVYLLFGILLAGSLGATGIALADAAAFTAQAALLLVIYAIQSLRGENRAANIKGIFSFLVLEQQSSSTWLRSLGGSIAGTIIIVILMNFLKGILPSLILGLAAAALGIAASLPFIKKELKILIRL
jgi:putative peptidoglycan lipid II flippase